MKKVLLISYYFAPFPGVGAKRMTYWANAFFDEQDPEFECTVLTTTPQKEKSDDIIYIEDTKSLWLDRFIQGISWVPNLKAYFDASSKQFDYIIISGGPFGHFWITRYLKGRFGAGIILDYRDPFSSNSRFKTSFIKDSIKKAFEKKFLKYADHLITVNDFCKSQLKETFSEDKISIIENGYDDRIMDTLPSVKFDDGLIHVVYAGSFFEDRNPTMFIRELLNANKSKIRLKFHHIGSPSPFLVQFSLEESIVQHGAKNYTETIRIMKRCDLGLIVTGGEPMESTTKIYDYIGCDLDLLIITGGIPKTGSIHAISAKVPDKVHWVQQQIDELKLFFDSYTKSNKVISTKEHFSRKFGFSQLKELLNKV